MRNDDIFECSNLISTKFIENEISNYSELRNFDFGPSKRENVSNLSKFITHRVVDEFSLIRDVLKKHKYKKVEKFIQEVFWRVYWKGWLENRPNVWRQFSETIDKIEKKKEYFDACEGKTNIDCFNDWITEIKKTNYLHNHTRMWFASIWIFTLKLPWQLGAEFFLKHLYDGDASSNTLSWRWVAGLQTKGKHYLAKSWNIEKFTNERYTNIKLNENAQPLSENLEYSLRENENYNYEQKNNFLIIFENDLFFNNRIKFYKKYEKIFIVLIDNNFRKFKLSENVVKFKIKIINDFQKKFDNSEIISIKNLFEFLKNNKNLDTIYPFVGENLDFANNLIKKFKLNLNYIYRNEDTFCWQYSKKGFFNFKKNIPNILKKLEL